MALDMGKKRIGLAISDVTNVLASPLDVIKRQNLDKDIESILKFAEQNNVELLLFGMPRNMDGSYGPQAKFVENFITKLKTYTDIPMNTWDERLSTVAATRSLIEGNVRREDRKNLVDKVAAAHFLQSYLDYLNNPNYGN